jgi:hypothetical protein
MTEDREALTLLASGDDYELLADAGATRFVFRCKAEHMTAYLSGEDAARFQADHATTRAQFPDWPADKTLAQLWDQGGYSWFAIAEGN